jgi:hypothetical protein
MSNAMISVVVASLPLTETTNARFPEPGMKEVCPPVTNLPYEAQWHEPHSAIPKEPLGYTPKYMEVVVKSPSLMFYLMNTS